MDPALNRPSSAGPSEGLADPLEQAWDKVDRAWGDPETHRRFLALAQATGRLAVAGRRYRQVASENPERADEAQRQVDRVIALAMQGLTVERQPPKGGPRRVVLLIGYLLALALLACVATLLLRGHS